MARSTHAARPDPVGEVCPPPPPEAPRIPGRPEATCASLARTQGARRGERTPVRDPKASDRGHREAPARRAKEKARRDSVWGESRRASVSSTGESTERG